MVESLQEKLKQGLAQALITDGDLRPTNPRETIHRPYRSAGRAIVRDWGWDTNESLNVIIEGLSDEKKTTPLLAYISHILESMEGTFEELSRTMRSMRAEQNRSSHESDRHGISDGCHHVIIRRLARSRGEILVEDCDQRQLSARAGRTIMHGLNESVLFYVSDISEKGLLEMDGCGEATTQELLAWRDKIISGKSSNGEAV